MSGHPRPATTDESWGSRMFERACNTKQDFVRIFIRCEDEKKKKKETLVSYIRRHSHLLEENVLLQQRHLNPQRLHLSDLRLCCVSDGWGQGCNPSISPQATWPGGAKAASFWPPSIPRIPLLMENGAIFRVWVQTVDVSTPSALNSWTLAFPTSRQRA